MANKKVLTFVTGNVNKINEVLQILGSSFPFQLENQALDLEEIQGTSLEVAKAKCQVAANIISGPVMIEDTSLEYKVMGGLPGPYVRWFLEKIGPLGLHQMLAGWEDKTAYAVCTIAFSNGPGSQVELFEGRTEGTIVPPCGEHGFGWDVCFQPKGYEVTYAQMEPQEKNKISHRSKAVRAFRDHMSSL